MRWKDLKSLRAAISHHESNLRQGQPEDIATGDDDLADHGAGEAAEVEMATAPEANDTPSGSAMTQSSDPPGGMTYTQMPQALVPIDTPLSIIHKHILRQSDIDKTVKNIETCVIHSLELPIQAQDLVKVYQHSIHFWDIYQYITDGKLPSSVKAQNCIRAKALNFVVIVMF